MASYWSNWVELGGRVPTLQLRNAVLTDIQTKVVTLQQYIHILWLSYTEKHSNGPHFHSIVFIFSTTWQPKLTIFPRQSAQLDNPTGDPEELSEPQGPCPAQCVKVAAKSTFFCTTLFLPKGPTAGPVFSDYYLSFYVISIAISHYYLAPGFPALNKKISLHLITLNWYCYNYVILFICFPGTERGKGTLILLSWAISWEMSYGISKGIFTLHTVVLQGDGAGQGGLVGSH